MYEFYCFVIKICIFQHIENVISRTLLDSKSLFCYQSVVSLLHCLNLRFNYISSYICTLARRTLANLMTRVWLLQQKHKISRETSSDYSLDLTADTTFSIGTRACDLSRFCWMIYFLNRKLIDCCKRLIIFFFAVLLNFLKPFHGYLLVSIRD